MDLTKPISSIPGIGFSYERKLNKLNIYSVSDLLYHPPNRYIDYSLTSTIDKVQEGEVVTLKGEIVKIQNNYIRGRRLTIQKAVLKDQTGSINITWFNQPYLVKQLLGQVINVSGKVTRFGKSLVLESPEYELVINNQSIHTGRLVAVYPETSGLSSKWLRRKIASVLETITEIPDPLPSYICNQSQLLDLPSALHNLHQPKNKMDSYKARRRLAFDELFYIQLINQLRKKEWKKEKVGYKLEVNKYFQRISNFVKNLPFELTSAQKKTAKEIFADLEKQSPMNRLLEGDVGSGKTVVAAIITYLTFLNGFRTLFMSPTEILSEQHYKTFSRFLTPMGIKIGLQTRSTKINDDANVIIGTHALLFNKIPYKKVALVIIDEQHRFGVEQRALLRKQKIKPHLLTMTATPIPRTIALTLYGELDLSTINQMPKGRKIVKTYAVGPEKYAAAFNWIRKKINKNRSEQAYIIYPLIEESEILKEVKAATVEFERLKKEAFPDLRLGLLHGKMSSSEKNQVINAFRNGTIDVLVSTSVVEVGMDIPNAVVMVIEGADRFGLAQLHQLRGRVGRSDKQSYCLLFSDKETRRLKAMETTFLGIKLAEIDLKIRGSGEIYGIKQHGRVDLKFADFSDIELIEESRRQTQDLLTKDETLSQYPKLKKLILLKLEKQVQPD